MPEITIIDNKKDLINIQKLSEVERDSVLNQIKVSIESVDKASSDTKYNSDELRNHFENYADSLTETLNYEKKIADESVYELKIRKIISRDVVPMIEIPRNNEVSPVAKIKTRGDVAKAKRNEISMDRDISAVIKSSEIVAIGRKTKQRYVSYIVPSGVEFVVKGFVLLDHCLNDLSSNFHSDPSNVSTKDRVSIGLGSQKYLAMDDSEANLSLSTDYTGNKFKAVGAYEVSGSFHKLHKSSVTNSDILDKSLFIPLTEKNIDILLRYVTNNEKYLYTADNVFSSILEDANRGRSNKAYRLFKHNKDKYYIYGANLGKKSDLKFVEEAHSNFIGLSPVMNSDEINKEFIDKFNAVNVHQLNKNISLKELETMGLTDVYFTALYKGTDSDEVNNAIDMIKAKNAREKFERESRNQFIEDRYEFNQVMLIAADKLTKTTLNKIHMYLENKPTANHKDIISLLNDNEKRIVKLERERKEQLTKQILENKCPHVKISRKFRLSKEYKKQFAEFKRLSKYFNDNTGDKMVSCNNCNLPIICPHVIMMTKNRMKRTSFKDMRADMAPFIDDKPYNRQYHCKICGESIMEQEKYRNINATDSLSSLQDDLNTLLWARISRILRNTRTDKLVNMTKLIVNIRDECYPYIATIESTINRSKTANIDDKKDHLIIFADIYIYAYIIHMITTNNKTIFMQGVASNAPISKYMTVALKHLVSSLNISMTKLGLSSDYVKDKFIKAYQLFRSSGKVTVSVDDKTTDIIDNLSIDKFYYMYNTAVALSKNKQIPEINRANALSLHNISKTKDAFRDLPQITNSKSKASLEPIIAYIKYGLNRTYDNFVYSDGEFTEEFAKTNELFNELSKSNDERHYANMNKYLKTPYSLKIDKTRQFSGTKVPLSYNYDEKGIPHDFSIYVFKGAELTLSEVDKARNSGRRLGKLLDKRCSRTGILRSKVKSLDEKKIADSLSNQGKISGFLDFYRYRCLKSGVHEYKKSTKDAKGTSNSLHTVCIKCKFDSSWKQTDSDAKKFMKANLSAYTKETSGDVTKQKLIIRKKVYKEFNYKYDFNKILDLGKKLKTNVNLISNLGATEAIDMKTITQGNAIPAVPKQKYNTRLLNLLAHLNLIIHEYNQIRNYHRMAKVELGIKDIIDKSGIKHQAIKGLSKLPSASKILNGFYKNLEYLKATKSPETSINYTLENICILLLKITSGGKPMDMFAKYILDKILYNDKVKSKYGYFSWSIFSEGYDPASYTASDSNTAIATDMETDPDGVADDTAKDFSLDAFDIGDEDAEDSGFVNLEDD